MFSPVYYIGARYRVDDTILGDKLRLRYARATNLCSLWCCVSHSIVMLVWKVSYKSKMFENLLVLLPVLHLRDWLRR